MTEDNTLERRAKELARERDAARKGRRRVVHVEKGSPAQVREAWERLAGEPS